MEYKASLDNLAKIITAGTIILFLVLGYGSISALSLSKGDFTVLFIQASTLFAFIAIILGCYLFAPQSYIMDNSDLIIVRPIKNKKIKLAEIAEIRAVADGDMIGAIRTFGVGGLFGYFGKFYSFKIGSMMFYATRRNNKILIITNQDQKIIITPDDISMIEKLKEKLIQKSK